MTVVLEEWKLGGLMRELPIMPAMTVDEHCDFSFLPELLQTLNYYTNEFALAISKYTRHSIRDKHNMSTTAATTAALTVASTNELRSKILLHLPPQTLL